VTLPVLTAVGIGTLVALGALALEVGQAKAQPPPCNEFRESGVEAAMRADPGHDKACHARAMALIRNGGKHDYRLGEAEQIYKTLLRLRPQSPFAYTGLAELQMRKLELGIEVEAPLQQIHDAAERGTRIPPVLPEAFVTLGRAELLMGCLPCAARAAELARAQGADTPELAALRSRIAEIGGNAERARAILESAIAAPILTAEDRSWLNGVLAEHHARGGRFEEADRALSNAVAAQSYNLSAYVRRAELRLFDLGDVEGALRAADGNRRAMSSIEFKRVRAMALYLEWSRGRITGRPVGDLQRNQAVPWAEGPCMRRPLGTGERVRGHAGGRPGAERRCARRRRPYGITVCRRRWKRTRCR
jgi:tetratricopeptide (TPR) repeat protein